MVTVLSLIIAGFMILITVFADSLIKSASIQNALSGWKLLLLGSVLYGITGMGWFFVMRSMKLSTLGVIYGLGCIILLVLISVFYFKEGLNGWEIFGVILAILSIVILARFS